MRDDDGGDDNTIGGTTAGTGNLISGNTGEGVEFDSGVFNGYVEGNDIGTNAAGTAGLGNGGDGVGVFYATSIFVGSSSGSGGNVIAFNGGAGVYEYQCPPVSVTNNSIYKNAGGSIVVVE